MAKALVLLSGGLDSLLAAKILMEQGIGVVGLSFKSYFFGVDKAKKAAKELGIELVEVDFSDEHLAMVKNPKYGYGKNMNPCIDCHGLMLVKAKEIMEKPPLNLPPAWPAGRLRKGENVPLLNKEGIKGRYDFVATGEVLGERPMSQNLVALKLVEKIFGITGRLLRPLSAKLLPETAVEKAGLVNRYKLLDISGRSRKRQLALARKYGIKEYSSPGGGCLLTEPVFSEKLIKMLEYWPGCQGTDVELLKHGRIYWLTLKQIEERKNGRTEGQQNTMKELLVVGRDEKDNENLEKLAQTGDVMIKLAEENGPTSLIRKLEIRNLKFGEIEVEALKELKMSELKMGEEKSEEEIVEVAAVLTGYYATKVRGKKVNVNIKII